MKEKNPRLFHKKESSLKIKNLKSTNRNSGNDITNRNLGYNITNIETKIINTN